MSKQSAFEIANLFAKRRKNNLSVYENDIFPE